MKWTRDRIERLGDVLDESTVFGLTTDTDSRVCRLLLEVDSLPEVGPLDADPRRVLLLSEVSRIEVLLQEQPFASETPRGPAIPLSSLDALNAFFASLTTADAMYGWAFIDDDEDPKRSWPDVPSLVLTVDEKPADHQLYWFTECSVATPDEESKHYFLQGLVRFDAVAVERADGSAMPLTDLVDDANRWWRAFHDRDPRVSVDAQRAAAQVAESWRPGGPTSSTTYVPGGC